MAALVGIGMLLSPLIAAGAIYSLRKDEEWFTGLNAFLLFGGACLILFSLFSLYYGFKNAGGLAIAGGFVGLPGGGFMMYRGTKK